MAQVDTTPGDAAQDSPPATAGDHCELCACPGYKEDPAQIGICQQPHCGHGIEHHFN